LIGETVNWLLTTARAVTDAVRPKPWNGFYKFSTEAPCHRFADNAIVLQTTELTPPDIYVESGDQPHLPLRRRAKIATPAHIIRTNPNWKYTV